MTDREERKEEFRKKLEFYQAAMEYTNDISETGMFIWDLNTNLIYLSRSNHIWGHFGHREDRSCTGEEWLELVHPRDRAMLSRCMNSVGRENGRIYSCDYRMIDQDDKVIWVNTRGKIVTDGEENGSSLMVGSLGHSDMEKRVDSLTGLLNQDAFFENFVNPCLKADRGYLFVLGVDRIKDLNNEKGWTYGDQIIRNLADILKDVIGNDMYIYRLSGDEFAVNLAEGSKDEAERLFHYCSKRMISRCSLSAGAVSYSAETMGRQDRLLQFAEHAMSCAKENGGGKLEFFSGDKYEKYMYSLALIKDLQQNIENNFHGFSVYYQPQINREFKLSGAEALLRYESEEYGPITPDVFIPILEKTGLIETVGDWVMRKALEQCREWRIYFPEMRVSVNMSYIQLKNPAIVDKVLSLLEELGMPGEALTLELTESIQMENYPYYNAKIREWKKKGLRFSVDDFGTGYSSLSYLKSLDIDEIKIDRFFIRQIDQNPQNHELLSNMTAFAKNVRLTVCCEGMEEEEELAAIYPLEPDLFQGFLFSKPVKPEVLENKFFNRNSREYGFWKMQRDALLKRFRPDTDAAEAAAEKMQEAIRNGQMPMPEGLTCSRCSNLKNNQMMPFYGFALGGAEMPALSSNPDVNPELRRIFEFERCLVSCSLALMENMNSDEGIRTTLEQTGRYYGAERILVFEKQEGKGCSVIYEWHRKSLEPMKDRLQDVPSYLLEDLMRSFSASHFGDENAEGRKEEWMKESGNAYYLEELKKLFIVPLLRKNDLYGYICVVNPPAACSDATFLRTISRFLTTKLLTDRTSRRLDELLGLGYQSIMKTAEIGLWGIKADAGFEKYELFTDDNMRRMMDIPEDLGPAETYNFWYSHISEGYRNYAETALRQMASGGRRIQLEYRWNHPQLGEIGARSIGSRTSDRDGKICLEGYHILLNNLVRPQHQAEETLCEEFIFDPEKKSAEFLTERNRLYGTGRKDEDFPESWIRLETVHPGYAKSFRLLFRRWHEGEKSRQENGLLRNQEGNYEWYRFRIEPMQGDAARLHVRVYEINGEQLLDLEYQRQNDFYHALLREVDAYCEIEADTGRVISSGGLWKTHADVCRKRDMTYEKLMDRIIPYVSYEEDWEMLRRCTRLETLREIYEKEDATVKYSFRWLKSGVPRWVILTIRVFKEQYTEKLYALYYLKDIDALMQREREQEEVASRDGLTGVYNRKAFEERVTRYMSDESADPFGILMIIDVDNFKQINDTYGHLEGDEVLKAFSEKLNHVFRQNDLIARYGGDEFLIFIKEIRDQKLIESRLGELGRRIILEDPINVEFSAGAVHAEGGTFCFMDALEKADKALYQSKESGKRKCTFYQEEEF